LTGGLAYYASVKAVDVHGNHVIASSDPIIVDGSAPTAISGFIEVHTLGTPDESGTVYVPSFSGLKLNWGTFIDEESSIAAYSVAVGFDDCGSENIVAMRSVGLSKTWTLEGALQQQAAITTDSVLVATVRGWNRAGLSADICSPKIKVDESGPNPGTVLDGDYTQYVNSCRGSCKEINYQPSDSRIDAHWAGFADEESGIVKYEWAVGSGPWPSQQVMAFEDVGAATSASCATEKCLHLMDGVRYVVTVRAWNGAGHYVEVVSDGVVVDRVVPTAGVVRDGDGSTVEDVMYQASLESLSARWSGYGDVPSGIELYRWAIGTSPGGVDLFNYRVIRGATSQSIDGLSLQTGLAYYVSVKGVDRAGNSVVAISNGVLVDGTPPKGGDITVDTLGAPDASGTDTRSWSRHTPVVGGRGGRADWAWHRHTVDTLGVPDASGIVDLPSWESLRVAWAGFEDAESEISTYAVGLGSGDCGSDDVVPLHDVGRRKVWSLDGHVPQCHCDSADLSLLFIVRAWNRAGLSVDVCSAHIHIDDTRPIAGVVHDGSSAARMIAGAEADFQSSAAQITAHWEGFADDESSIVMYQWAIGSGPRPSQQVMEFVDIDSTNASCTTGGCLALEDGVTYFVTVRGFNGAGLVAEAVSSGVQVDTVAPTAGTVWDGAGSDAHGVSYQLSLDALSARWSGFADALSGIAAYRFAIGTNPGSDNVHAFATVPVADGSAVGNVTAFGYERAVAMSDIAVQLTIAETAASAADTAADAAVEEVLARTASRREAGLQLDSANLALADAISEPESEAAAVGVDEAAAVVGAAANALSLADAEVAKAAGVQAAAAANLLVAKQTAEEAAQGQLADGIRVTGLPLRQGRRYFVSILAEDRAGNTATASSNGVIADASPPSGGNVRVVAGAAVEVDGKFSVSGKGGLPVLELSWQGFNDEESGIAAYALGLGSHGCGSDDVLRMHGVGLRIHDAIAVQVKADTVHAVVRVWNGAGLSADYCSQAIHIDGTAPSAGVVFDGAPLRRPADAVGCDLVFLSAARGANDTDAADADDCAGYGDRWALCEGTCVALGCTTSTVATNLAATPINHDNFGCDAEHQTMAGRIDAHWAGFADDESGIVKYEWAVGSGPRPSQQVMAFQEVTGLATSASCPPRCAFDAAGACPALCTRTAASPAVAAAAAVAGFCGDAIYRTEYDCLSARGAWAAAVPYVPAVAAVAARCEMVGGCSDLEDGVTYRVTVRAWNGAGEFVDAVSDGSMVDGVAPTAGAVWDGDGSKAEDLACQASLDSLSARWSGFADVPSGVEHYRWAVGTTPGGVDVRGFTPVPRVASGPDAHNASAVNTIDSETGVLPLGDGVRYFLSVMAVDHAGNTVVQSSNGVLVDSTPPDIGVVRDGTGSSDVHSQPLGPLSASWSEFLDAGSGVVRYEWAVGSSPCATDVQGYTNVGMALHARMASAEGLAGERRYFVAVRATDGAGLSSAATSNGVWVAGERAGAELAAVGAPQLPLPLETTPCE
jgi:hypothetical protein